MCSPYTNVKIDRTLQLIKNTNSVGHYNLICVENVNSNNYAAIGLNNKLNNLEVLLCRFGSYYFKVARGLNNMLMNASTDRVTLISLQALLHCCTIDR